MLDIAWFGFPFVCLLLGIGALWFGEAMLRIHNRAGVKYVTAGAGLALLLFLTQFWDQRLVAKTGIAV